ncbi:MAG: permease [Aquificaceae bacterium]|nr:permease [Aquificaceae bacterium]MDW8097576.1 permease [Aquificaceae bacterium]
MRFLTDFAETFYQYSLDIFPYFLLAVIVTSFLQSYAKLSWLKGLLRQERGAPLYTALLGGLLPLCSCSMLPLANLINSLSRSYAPVLSFLVVAPVVSPVTLLLTYGYFGLSVTFWRLFGTLLFALLFAYAMGALFRKPTGIPLSVGGGAPGEGRVLAYLKSNLVGIGKYLLLGIFIASLIKSLFPPSFFSPLAGSLFSYLFLSLTSVPLYMCSGEEVPIARALREMGFSEGRALSFMLGGTGVCLPTVLATLKFLPKGLVLAYVLFWVLFSIAMGLFYDILFQ